MYLFNFVLLLSVYVLYSKDYPCRLQYGVWGRLINPFRVITTTMKSRRWRRCLKTDDLHIEWMCCYRDPWWEWLPWRGFGGGRMDYCWLFGFGFRSDPEHKLVNGCVSDIGFRSMGIKSISINVCLFGGGEFILYLTPWYILIVIDRMLWIVNVARQDAIDQGFCRKAGPCGMIKV